MRTKKTLDIIYTEIGRGHPFYLDGTVDALRENYSANIDLNIDNVFKMSKGIPFRLWRLVDNLYRRGSQGGIPGIVYKLIRSRKGPANRGLIEAIMARDIRQSVHKRKETVLTAHPFLAAMLSDLTEVIYQHAEIAAPAYAMIRDASLVLVPLEETRDRFTAAGVPGENIHVTGLCIEPRLIDALGVNIVKRQTRIKERDTLVGAFYSSGAEPKEHLRKIIAALTSLDKAGQKGVVFCTAGGTLEKAIMNKLKARRFVPGKKEERFHEAIAGSNILAVIHNERKQIDEYTAELFRYYDYIVAPSHERSNWAVGLGLPMFILHPLIGPFSPLNRDFLIKEKVAAEILTLQDAGAFAELLEKLRASGELLKMSANGYNRYDLNGFARSAELIDEFLERTLPE